jgi:hypothetical protein
LHRAAPGCRETPAPYKQSLLPAFQGETPRYRITVRLDPEALTLTDRQQVPYTNNEGSKSVGLNPRAERAKPLRDCGSPARRALPF